MDTYLSSLISAMRFSVIGIDLQLQQPVRFSTHHHGAILYGTIMEALGRPAHFPEHIILHPVESGYQHYARGDLYRMAFTCLPGKSDATELARMLDEHGAERTSRPHVLGGNYRVERIWDCIGPSTVEGVPPLFIGEDQMPSSSMQPGPDGLITLRFFGPLRMPRAQGDKRPRAAFFDNECFDPGRFLSLLIARIARLTGQPAIPQEDMDRYLESIGPTLVENRLFWLDVPYTGKTLGGAIGEVSFRADTWPQDVLKLLWFGQYLHAGKNTAFGFGEYRWVESVRPFIPKRARSFLDRMIEPDNLSAAMAHIGRKDVQDQWLPMSEDDESDTSGSAGQGDSDATGFTSEVSADHCDAYDAEFLSEEIARLQKGNYACAPLTGLFIRSNEQSYRPLAIPVIRDRLLQRAALQILAPDVNQLLDDSAYAYRAGLSRHNAAWKIEQAYRDGYRYVLEADIVSFFDNVDLSGIIARIQALWREDPIVKPMIDWLQAPVLFDGQKIQRDRGLPQGAVISPMLSNLFLVDFDRRISDHDLKLVRYSDDFVVLARTAQQARDALTISEALLHDHGLKLNAEKTRIVSYDDGFRFLGFLFCRSVTLEVPSGRSRETAVVRSKPELKRLLEESSKPLAGWASNIDPDNMEKQRKSFWSRSLKVDRPMERDSAPLYLHGWGLQLSVYQEDLVIRDTRSNETNRLPWHAVSELILSGPPSLSGRFLYRAARDGKPITLCRQDGEILGVLHGPKARVRYELLETQLRKSHDMDFCIRLAHKIVRGKIRNQTEVLRRQIRPNLDGELKLLRSILEQIGLKPFKIETMDELRGFEGNASAIYFKAFQRCLPDGFNHMGPRGRGAKDPTNALLNFLYTMVMRHVRLALMGAGLHPGIGLIHVSRGRFDALAADMMEEFRQIAELLTLRLFHRGTLKPEDFYTNKDDPRMWLTRNARKRVILAFEERMDRPMRMEGYPAPLSFRDLMQRQAKLLRQVLLDQQTAYRPYILP